MKLIHKSKDGRVIAEISGTSAKEKLAQMIDWANHFKASSVGKVESIKDHCFMFTVVDIQHTGFGFGTEVNVKIEIGDTIEVKRD